MLRCLTLVSSILALSSCAVAPGGGAPPAVLELVVFRVTDAGTAEPLRVAAHERIATYPGFVRALRLCAVEDPLLFADVVLWRSLADAKAAMGRAESDPAVLPFFGALGPIVSMGHYALTPAASPNLLATLARAPVVEIAAYTVKDAGLQDAAQPALHEALRGMPVVIGNAPLKPLEGEHYIDLIGWQSAAAWQATGEQMQGDPQAAAFFSNVGEMKVFALFAVAGSSVGQ